jgi:hypothetical protein
VLCRCGGRIVEYYYPKAQVDLAAKPPEPINWQDVGKFLGAKVTGGNPLGAFVGGLIGKVMEGDVLSMTPVIEPPVVNVVGINGRALGPMKEKIGRAISVGGVRRRRDKKSKKDVR